MATLQYPLSKVVDTTDKIHTIVTELKNNQGTNNNDTQILNAMAGDTYFDVEFIPANAYGNASPYYQVSGKLRSFNFVGYLGTYTLNNQWGYTSITKIETQLTDPNIIFINGTKIYNTSALYPYYIFPYNNNNSGVNHSNGITTYNGEYLIRLHSLNTKYTNDENETYYCILFYPFNWTASTDGTINLYKYNVSTNKFDTTVNSGYTNINIFPIYKYIQNDIYYITSSSNVFDYNSDNIESLFCANNKPQQIT